MGWSIFSSSSRYSGGSGEDCGCGCLPLGLLSVASFFTATRIYPEVMCIVGFALLFFSIVVWIVSEEPGSGGGGTVSASRPICAPTDSEITRLAEEANKVSGATSGSAVHEVDGIKTEYRWKKD